MVFEWYCPTKIIFGVNSLDKVGYISKSYGKKALIVSGKNSMQKYGVLKKISNHLEKEKIQKVNFYGISSNPKSNEINEAINLIKSEKCDLIISVGGGSTIDAAKAISIGNNYNSIEEIIGKTLDSKINSIPVIAIPTTAGSGAEVTKGAIITDTKRKFKSGIRGNQIFPRVAIIDPYLTLTMPKDVTIDTGFDTLTHAVESYIAKKSNPLTDLYAEQTIKIISGNLKKVISNPQDLEARTNMSYASLLGGINIANASSCLPHRLQQAMGSIYEVSHGKGLAAVYPAWLKEEYNFAKEKLDKISSMFGNEKGVTPILKFMEKIGIYTNLKQFDVKKADVPKILEKVDGNITNDPIPNINYDLMSKILYKSL